MSLLTYDKNDFYLNGEKFRIYSGAIHYFRVVPEYWKDRLIKLKQCGFNTVETVVPWNLHEPKHGEYDFSGIKDIEKFIDTAREVGLYVILRPGPYMCAEFNMGGLPYWLLKEKDMKVRCYHDSYLKYVEEYFNILLPKFKDRLIENGGNIIAVQIENEYGSFGDDKKYLRFIQDLYNKNGISCLHFTSDGPGYFMLGGGTLNDVLATVNFGSNPKDNFALLKKFRPDAPTMCMEYWNGWFDHWYEEHHKRESGETAQVLSKIISAGNSVNLYMFHGGTNFGFMGGANYTQHLEPMVTSYDYNCPVSECGDLTDKYMQIHDVMEKHLGRELPITQKDNKKEAYGKVMLLKRADLFENIDNISKPIYDSNPLSFEELDVDTGYVLYESDFEGPFENLELEIDDLRDRAIIYVDDKQSGVKEDTGKRWDKVFSEAQSGEKRNVKILTEIMGRVNYGGHILDRKGILRGVRIANRYHFGWKMYPLSLDDISDLQYKSIDFNEENEPGIYDFDTKRPAFYEGEFTVDEANDTFVKMTGFSKGCVYINGFNIGRYFNEAGPQKTLYVPAPVLNEGVNKICVFETDEMVRPEVIFTDKEEL